MVWLNLNASWLKVPAEDNRKMCVTIHLSWKAQVVRPVQTRLVSCVTWVFAANALWTQLPLSLHVVNPSCAISPQLHSSFATVKSPPHPPFPVTAGVYWGWWPSVKNGKTTTKYPNPSISGCRCAGESGHATNNIGLSILFWKMSGCGHRNHVSS